MYTQLGPDRVRYLDTVATRDPNQPPLVLIHGFGANLDEWGKLLPLLTQQGYRVVAIDLRGHGYSDRPEDGDYSIPAQAQLILQLLDQLGIERFVPVGHSWGSAITLELALKVPTRIPRVVLFNGMLFEEALPLLFAWAHVPGVGETIFSLFYTERVDEKLAWSMFSPELYLTDKTIENAERAQARPGTVAAALATIRAMDFAAQEPQHFNIQQPVLLLWGREDQVTPLKYGERLALRLPHARLVVVPRCGHLPMIEAQHLVADEMFRFLKEGQS